MAAMKSPAEPRDFPQKAAETAAKSRSGPELVRRLDERTDVAHAARGGVELSVGILLWPRFPLLSLAGLSDALRHAADVGDQSRQLRCTWTVLGVGGESVTSSCGVAVPVQTPLDRAPAFDYLAVIGGLLSDLPQVDPRYADFVRASAARGVPLIGLCTGSFVLAQLGLMKQHTACVHPFHVPDWQVRHPTLPYVTDTDFLIDGPRLTVAGGTSVIAFASQLIRKHCGPDRAAKVVHQMTVTPAQGRSYVDRRNVLGFANFDSDRVRRAVMLMEEHLSAPLNVATIAEVVGCSTRQLERQFSDETGTTPAGYYRQMRLRYGRWLLTAGDTPISAVAYECGFADAAHFIRHFQREFGVPPGAFRRQLMRA